MNIPSLINIRKLDKDNTSYFTFCKNKDKNKFIEKKNYRKSRKMSRSHTFDNFEILTFQLSVFKVSTPLDANGLEIGEEYGFCDKENIFTSKNKDNIMSKIQVSDVSQCVLELTLPCGTLILDGVGDEIILPHTSIFKITDKRLIASFGGSIMYYKALLVNQ